MQYRRNVNKEMFTEVHKASLCKNTKDILRVIKSKGNGLSSSSQAEIVGNRASTVKSPI
jgi:hypothetical protein